MRKPHDFQCKLGGRTWTIRFVRRGHKKVGKSNWGMCYRETREIYVRYDLSEKTFIEVLIHECQHALSDMHFSAEEWVTETSAELAIALMAANLRIKDGKS